MLIAEPIVDWVVQSSHIRALTRTLRKKKVSPILRFPFMHEDAAGGAQTHSDNNAYTIITLPPVPLQQNAFLPSLLLTACLHFRNKLHLHESPNYPRHPYIKSSFIPQNHEVVSKELFIIESSLVWHSRISRPKPRRRIIHPVLHHDSATIEFLDLWSTKGD